VHAGLIEEARTLAPKVPTITTTVPAAQADAKTRQSVARFGEVVGRWTVVPSLWARLNELAEVPFQHPELAAEPRAGGEEDRDRRGRVVPHLPGPEIARLGRTLRAWKEQCLAYFTTGRASNGGTEAMNGIIELHRRIARGFRNPTNYRLRMILAAGRLSHPNLR
jgi:hypothetical protein